MTNTKDDQAIIFIRISHFLILGFWANKQIKQYNSDQRASSVFSNEKGKINIFFSLLLFSTLYFISFSAPWNDCSQFGNDWGLYQRHQGLVCRWGTGLGFRFCFNKRKERQVGQNYFSRWQWLWKGEEAVSNDTGQGTFYQTFSPW